MAVNDDVTTKKAIDVTPDKNEGVLKEILREGEGEQYPLSGDRVSVHYVGTLLEDGSQFDSSRDRGEMFTFTLGKGEVIKAWDLGVATMKKGEISKLTCKSSYAYGERGSPPKIPPNATLVFEVELFGWKGEDLSPKKDGGITRRIISQGEDRLTPNDGAIVKISFVGRVNGTVFDERQLQFILGEGCEHNVPEGLERALEKFKKNEKSIITLAPSYAFGSEGNSSLATPVPPNSTVEYNVHLEEFEKAKESWEMDQEEKLEQAKLCKERGTEYFKDAKYRLAIKRYKKVTNFVQYDSGLSDDQKKESQSLLLAGYLNLSMCYLKLKNCMAAKENATKALEIDKNNVKAYFRRGQALLIVYDAAEAKNDFMKCLSLDPGNKAAAQQLQICNSIIAHQKVREQQLYKGMFDKFAKVDAKKAAAHRLKTDVMSGDLGEWETKREQNMFRPTPFTDNEIDEEAEFDKEYEYEHLRDLKFI